MSTSLFCKLTVDDDFYFFRATFDRNDDLELVAVSAAQAWKVKLTRAELVQLSSSQSKNFPEYRTILEKAFDDDDPEIVLTVKSCTPSTLEIVWKKLMTNDVYFNLGGSKLVGTELGPLLAELIGGLLGERSRNLTRIAALEDTNSRLSRENTEAIELLDEANEAKRTLEDQVLGRFVKVLNSKKKEITSLKNGEESNTADNNSIQFHEPRRSVTPVGVRDSPAGKSDSGEETDEEKETLVRQRSDAAGRRQANAINATAELTSARSNKTDSTSRPFVPSGKRRRFAKPDTDLNPPQLRRSGRSLNKSGVSNDSRMSLD